MKVNWTGGISLLGSRAFWAQVVAFVLVVGGVFGAKPEKEWAVVKNEDGSYRNVDPTDVTNLPEGTVLYEGTKAGEVKREVWTTRLTVIGGVLGGLLAMYFVVKDPNTTTFLPPQGPSNTLRSVLWGAGGVGLMFLVGGCSNAERLEYAAYRDADFHGLSVTRAEQESNSKVLAGDKDGDGHVTAEEAGPVDPVTLVPTTPIDTSALPNLNKLTVAQRDAWLHLRMEELDQSKARYDNSKALDAKATAGTGPFGFFTTLFGGGK